MCILKNNAFRCVGWQDTTKTKNIFWFGCIFVIYSFRFFDAYYSISYFHVVVYIFLDCIFVLYWFDFHEYIFIGFYTYTKSLVYFFDFIFWFVNAISSMYIEVYYLSWCGLCFFLDCIFVMCWCDYYGCIFIVYYTYITWFLCTRNFGHMSYIYSSVLHSYDVISFFGRFFFAKWAFSWYDMNF